MKTILVDAVDGFVIETEAESIGVKSYYYDPEKKDLVALKNFLTQNLD